MINFLEHGVVIRLFRYMHAVGPLFLVSFYDISNIIMKIRYKKTNF